MDGKLFKFAAQFDKAPKLYFMSSHSAMLDILPYDCLKEYAADLPKM